MEVTKSDGEKEQYSAVKLCNSIKAAGAPEALAEDVCAQIEARMDEDNPSDMSTKRIFRQALSYLVKEDIDVAARYSLRRAVDSLGPAGFYFEQYIEAILQAHGYETEQGARMQGQCIDHEIDVLATKGNQHFLVEAKFRNSHSIKTHVDVVMYADARLMDIERALEGTKDNADHVMWVITNTRFTKKSIQYAKCRGVKLVGWTYPKEGNLHDMIERKKLYPVTVLPTVKQNEMRAFATKGIVLVSDLLVYTPETLAEEFAIKDHVARHIIEEAQSLTEE